MFTIALNSIFGSFLVIILIFIDYIRKYNTEAYQRSLFLRILAFVFISMAADFAFFFLEGRSGKTVYILLHTGAAVYHVFLTLAFYHSLIFADYEIFKNKRRTVFIYIVTSAVCALTVNFLFINLNRGFCFYITDKNIFIRGDYYFVYIITCFLPLLAAAAEVFSARKFCSKQQILMVLRYVFFTALGSALTMLYSSVIWPFIAAALLYSYFFIVQNDSKIDILTGLGNRYSLNEFITRLEHSRRKKNAWSIVMIDMDHFKKINDTLGHSEGDNALKDMASVIKSCTGRAGFAARYGGDEFVLAARAGEIKRLMENIHRGMDELNRKGRRPYQLEISYGHDVYVPNSGKSAQEFLNHIDALMYKHKHERRRAEDKKGETSCPPFM